jgi:hypothetical protein
MSPLSCQWTVNGQVFLNSGQSNYKRFHTKENLPQRLSPIRSWQVKLLLVPNLQKLIRLEIFGFFKQYFPANFYFKCVWKKNYHITVSLNIKTEPNLDPLAIPTGKFWIQICPLISVDNDNHFASFFAKKWLQTIIVFREKMMRLLR